jgi:hypothetical protein
LGDAFLFVVGLAWLADVDRAAVGEREVGGDEALGAEQAADGLPVARGVLVLEAFADPAQEVVRWERSLALLVWRMSWSSGPSSTTSGVSMESRITPSTVAWGRGLAA